MHHRSTNRIHTATNAPAYLFRPLKPEEEAAGYEVVNAAVRLAARRNPKSWQYPFPRENYARRHARGENHGLFRDGELVSVLSLGDGAPRYWLEWRHSWHLRRLPPLRRLANRHGGRELLAPFAWLSSLGTGDVPRRRNLGRLALREAIQLCRARGLEHLYLECGDGPLARYYRSLGFERRARRKSSVGVLCLMHLDIPPAEV